jgi:NADPH:quinone reductase-like Zn-dependent oxidoreductase
MKAIQMHAFGGPEVLALEDISIPEPKADEVLVKVHAASVNPVDWKIRKGGYPTVKQEDLPVVPGRDIAGEVVALGADIGRFSVGDAVYAFLDAKHGGYEEYVAVKAGELAPKPGSIDMTTAAAVPLAALTAWQGLFDHGAVRAGQRVLIHGGAGGVGHFAIQFAKARGAWVATTVSADDLDFVHGLGADQMIDYKSQRFEELLEPVDMVFDLVGGETRDRSFNVLKKMGIMVSTLGEPDRRKAEDHGIQVAGYLAQPSGQQLAEIARLIDAGKVRVEVRHVFPLSEAATAQRVLEEEHGRGKVVLRVVN